MDSATASNRSAFTRRLVWPIVLLMGSLLAVVLAVAWFAADTQNRQAITFNKHLLAGVLEAEQNELSNWVRDYTYWDDFVENLVLSVNEEWAAENIGDYAHESLNVDITFVVDGQNAPAYVSVSPDIELSNSFELLPKDLVALADQARAVIGPAGESPVPKSAYTWLEGQLYMASASAAKWEEETERPQRAGGLAVMLYLRVVNAEMLERFEAKFGFAGLRLVNRMPETRAAIPLGDSMSGVIAYAIWEQANPGSAFLKTLTLPLVLAVFLAGGLLLLIVGRLRTAGLRLIDAHNHLSNKTKELERSRVDLAQARDEAEQASQAKTEFLARMSHDLRTPLNAILGFSEVIAEQRLGTGKVASKRYQEYAALVHRGGDHLRALIDDILDVSRLESGRYDILEEVVALDETVEHCLTIVQAKDTVGGVHFASEPSGLYIRVDRQAIEQILLNVLGNAVKFTPHGGQISVITTCTSDWVEVAISDTGCGMDTDEVQAAFALFTQGPAGIATPQKGFGLGLSIVKGLTELHEGRVRIGSEPRQGTTVTIQLPIERMVQGAETPSMVSAYAT